MTCEDTGKSRKHSVASLGKNSDVQIVRATGGELFLVNTSASSITLLAQELFGFNVGEFKEIPAGR